MVSDPPWIVEIKQTYPSVFEGMGEFMFACDEGWRDLITEALAKMFAADPDLRILQIKEKFGLLRIYAQTDSEEAQQAQAEAEDLSSRVCEKCGKRGKLSQPWLLTLCPACKAELRRAQG